MTYELAKDPNRRFSYCETGYLKRWIEENPKGIDVLKKLIQNGLYCHIFENVSFLRST